MSFIVILPLLALLGLVVVFGVTYKRNGLKAAFTAVGIALAIFFDIICGGNLRERQRNALNLKPLPKKEPSFIVYFG